MLGLPTRSQRHRQARFADEVIQRRRPGYKGSPSVMIPVTACAPSVPAIEEHHTVCTSAIRSLMSTPDFAARSVEIAMTRNHQARVRAARPAP